jgi:hypothetical protein
LKIKYNQRNYLDNGNVYIKEERAFVFIDKVENLIQNLKTSTFIQPNCVMFFTILIDLIILFLQFTKNIFHFTLCFLDGDECVTKQMAVGHKTCQFLCIELEVYLQ